MSKILYVQVIEAREVTSRIATTALTPIVTVKYNGSLTNKKTTTYKQNKTYWAEIFTFSTENVKSDFVTFELREKGYHVLSSDWIGETQIKLSDYDDGNVHLKWFRLGESKLKQHTKRPRGVLLLKIHLTTKNDKPFYKKPVEKVLSYDEWLEWSEAHYAAKFKNASTSDDYYPKAEDVLPSTRSRSKSLSEESSSKKERKEKKEKREKKEKTEADPGIFSRDVAPASKSEKKKLSKSVSEKKVKSKPEANSAFDPSTSPVAGSIAKGLSQSSKDNGSQKGKMKPSGFPISPIVGSPAAKQAVVGDLIDFSDFVEVPTTKPQSYNPFSDVYLSNPFQNMNLQEKRSYNPFLEPNEQLTYAR